MRAKKFALALLTILLAILVSGCGSGLSYTPEDAAVRTVTQRSIPELKVDSNSVQVLQKQSFGDKFMVLLTFHATHADFGAESCLYSYMVSRAALGGWSVSGGGGSCSVQATDPEIQPISIESGGGTFGPTDLGYSNVDGLVLIPDVKLVQIHWTDGKVEPVKVINNSYLTVRAGQLGYTKVEALDAQNQVIYTYDPTILPGKP